MRNYLLDKDKIIGHELLEEKNLFNKKLSLQDVFYNNFITNILSEFYEVFPESLYEDIKFAIHMRIEYNILHNLSLKTGKERIKKSHLEKRINSLQFQFTNSYLRNALKILEQNENLS